MVNNYHPYQQNKQPPLNSDGQPTSQHDGQQYHQYQQNKQSPLNSDGQQLHNTKQTITSKQ